MKYYKVLDGNGGPIYGTGRWSLPEGSSPGRWMPRVDDLVACESGYHLCAGADLVKWLGPRIFLAEARGEVLQRDDKVVAHEARLIEELVAWTERTARLYACDCADRALPLFEQARPGDNRPREAISVARHFARGEATRADMAAAGDAASAAAWSAARSAAGDAASDAARSAASAAARSAASAAARSAARSAASAAAWSAARSAASDAAGDAAWDAAREKERHWQTKRLFDYLEGRA